MRRFALVVLGAAATALVAALPAAGKEGVTATLLTKIPLDAPAGTRLEVGWRLTYRDHGRRHPFGAGGVFVRLRSATGASAESAFVSGTGRYRATVRVPEGGIGDVEIGLRGWTSGPSGLTSPMRCSRSRTARYRAPPESRTPRGRAGSSSSSLHRSPCSPSSHYVSGGR